MAELDLAEVTRVLVVKPSSLGDIIHTLPVVQGLAKCHPHWQIDWVTSTPWLPLLKAHPALNQAIDFPRKQFSGLRSLGFITWLKELQRKGNYELSLDFQGLQRSAIIARFALQKNGVAWGLGQVREGAGLWLHQQAPQLKKNSHAVERYHSLGTIAGLDTPANQLPVAQLPKGTCPKIAHDFALKDYLLIHPYSRGMGKALAPNLLAQLLRGLESKQVILVGQARETERLKDVPKGVLDLTNQTSLAELCWLMANSAGVISVDSGPMHLAACFDVPLLGLHAWSDPQLVGPWRPEGMSSAWVWKAGALSSWKTFCAQGKQQNMNNTVNQSENLDEACVKAAISWVNDL